MEKNKSFFIENLGCSKNQVDAETIIQMLSDAGWRLTEESKQADVIIVNTCGFINEAKEESIDVTLEYKNAYPGKKVIMAGCLSQRYGKELKKELHEVDGFVGNKNLESIKKVLGITETKEEKSFYSRKHLLSFPGSAYVKIAEGCNNRCSYCSIPLIRGDLKSRMADSVVSEIKELLGQGVFEMNLVAQDLGSFGSDRGDSSITSLFRAISALEGKFWLRPLYIHPDKFPFELLDIIKNDSRLLPYFDIPFQHASEKVLTRMGRKGNPEVYLELIRKIREAIPGAVIRSTLLVGFPGESKEDFQILLDFQEKAAIDWLGVFPYSREEETPAYDFNEQVPSETAKARKELIESRQQEISENQMERFVENTYPVLIEEKVEEEDFYLGRIYAQAPEVDGLTVVHAEGLKSGQVVNCRIVKRNGFDLEGIVE